MAKDKKQRLEDNRIKASFCRQLFPDLLNFLKDFDISEVKGQSPMDSLNMHFLLQAYEHKVKSTWINKIKDSSVQTEEHQKEIEILKATCKWKLTDVEEKDVLLAIDEYFDITAGHHDLTDLRNALVENAINGNSKKEWKFEDSTTLGIINYLGIHPTKTEIGYQRQAFSLFVRNAKGLKIDNNVPEIYFDKLHFNEYEELCFTNAFHLLRCLRNWGSHSLEGFLADEKMRYYRFILFTHIGIAYVCRRIWNKYGDTLSLIKDESQNEDKSKMKYVKPKAIELTKDRIEVIISANNSNEIISKCEYRIEGQNEIFHEDKEGNLIKFSINVPKYTSFTIKFRCEGYAYEITRCMNYYAWNPTLTISVQPPAKIHCSCKGFAEIDDSLERIIGDLFTKYLGSFTNPEMTKKQEEANKTILHQLAAIEPLLRDTHILAKNNINEKQVLLCKINEVKKQLADLNDKLKPVYGDISDTAVGVKVIIDILKSWEKSFKNGVIAVIMIIAGGWFFLCCNNEIPTNLFWLKYKWIILFIAFAISYLSFKLLSNTWNPYKAIIDKDCKMKYCISTIILLFILIGSPFALLKYPNISSLVNKYNFAENKISENQEVVSFLEQYFENDNNEKVIVQLAKYYLNYTGEDDRAYEIVKPLLDNPNVHKQSLLFIAEIFFAKGDFKEVYDIIERYKGKEQGPCINRLEGLLYTTPAVNMLDYQKGDSLLKLAAQQGDTEALYWLGHLRSNVSGIWKSTYQDGEKQFSLDVMDYDLISSINYLRQAANKSYPKAALELGNIYLDLNIVDSAELYYKRVLEISDRNIKDEAYYRLGLLEERRDKITDNYMQKAVDNNFEPALLHKANNSGNAGILFFSKMGGYGGYKGYRYIPPIVFRYLNKDRKDSALITLQRVHPNDNIDSRFVDAIEAIYSKDSLANDKGRKLFSSLSNQCKYAQMLSTYWELKKLSAIPNINVQTIKEKIVLLEGIGKEIPIAYALVAYILKNMGTNFIEESDKFAQMAIMAGHPGGAAVLAYFPQSYFNTIDEEINSFFKDKTCTKELLLPWNKEKVEKLAKIRSKIHLALRMSIPHWMTRTQFINYGQKIDYILFSMTKDGKVANDTNVINRGYPDEHLRFWSNVAMGVNDFDNEGWMSYQYHRLANQDFSYREKIIESMLRCVFIGNDILHSKQQAEQQIDKIALAFPYIQLLEKCRWDTTMIEDNLSNYLSEMPESFKTEMKSKYGSDTMIKRILEKEQIVDNLFILGTSTINGSNHAWFDNDRSLLEDWSAADEGRISLEPRLKK